MLVRMVDTIDPMQLLECASIRALLMMFLIGNNRLAAAYLGKAYPGQPGLNNVQIVISDDGGNSWNEPHAIFFPAANGGTCSDEWPGRKAACNSKLVSADSTLN